MKKFMIVSYEEKKIPTFQDKFNAILKNKYINKENKVKLINQILINKKQNQPIINILKNNTETSNEKNEQLEEIEQNNNQPDTYDQSNFYDFNEEEENPSEEGELNENISTDNTFTDADDYLAPAFQTRSQKDVETPWKNSKKRKRNLNQTEIETEQKNRAINLTQAEKINQATSINTKKKKKIYKKKRLSKPPKTPKNKKISAVNQNRKKNPIALSLDKIKLLRDAENSSKQPSSNQVDISMVDIQNGNGWQKY